MFVVIITVVLADESHVDALSRRTHTPQAGCDLVIESTAIAIVEGDVDTLVGHTTPKYTRVIHVAVAIGVVPEGRAEPPSALVGTSIRVIGPENRLTEGIVRARDRIDVV